MPKGTPTRVRVEEDDFLKAVRNHSGRCAVARAVRRTFPDAGRVMVDIQTIRFTLNGERLTWITPPKAQDSIVAFDAGEFSRLEPFDFDLRRDKAHKVARWKYKSEEDRQRALAARRERQSGAGVKRTRSSDPRAPRRSMGANDRAYGARAMSINKYRADDGLLGEVEQVPNP